MKKESLQTILSDHKMWLDNRPIGKRADLRGADLRGANLRGADLRRADLRGADLDFSCLPLWCGSFDMKVDDRIVSQIFCHFTRLNVSECSPYVRYCHRFMTNLFGKFMTNLFCKYRTDVDNI